MNQALNKVTDLPSTSALMRFERQTCRFARIKLLCQMAKEVQKHRGLTMACLSGENAFTQRVQEVESRTAATLALLAGQDAPPSDQRWSRTLQRLHNDWQTILIGWEQDQLLHNFEFHSHLVASLKRLILDELKPQLPAQAETIETFSQRLFDTTESLAMLRGLSMSAAVVRACGSDSHARLGFQIKEVVRNNEALLRCPQPLGLAEQSLALAKGLREHQIGLQRFLISIRTTILEQHGMAVDSSELFRLSTGIVDAYWAAFDLTVHALEGLQLRLIIDSAR